MYCQRSSESSPSGSKTASTKQKRDPKKVVQDFHVRQTRQILSIAAALFLVLFVAVVHKRPDLFGEFPKSVLFGIQAVLIGAFIGFSAVNWRCPSCNKFLGNDVHQDACRRCGVRLR
jgi:hypothetical protein